MAGSVNKAIIVGNLGRDPEIRTVATGSRIGNLSVATSESWRDKATGERKESTQWHRVVLFDERLCDVAEKYLRKGAKVYLEGQIETRKWIDQSGQDRYSTEIVLRPFRGVLTMLDGGNRSQPDEGGGDYGAATGKTEPRKSELDDEIPF